MKVLFLCHRFPLPAEGGGKIRALHMVRHLAEAGHNVTLCSLTRSEAEAQAVPEMERICERVVAVSVEERRQALRMLAWLPTTKPSSFGYFHSPELQQKINALLREESWDLVLVHCSSMGPYVEHATGVPKLMDFADMDSQKWLMYAQRKRAPASWGYALEGHKVKRAEARLARNFDVCTTISMGELRTLESYGTGTKADWFPNGVDLDYFAPAGPGEDVGAASGGGLEAYDPDLIAFVGRMDYFPNAEAMQWFCTTVWPRLRARRKSLKLRIVGANPTPAVQLLGQMEGVDVTGTVPDVRPCLRAAALSIAPLTIARGLQNKVLECMAMGIPVVTNERVASGLGFDDESPLVVAASDDDYLDAILGIVENPDRRRQLSEASRALVEHEFSWAGALGRLDGILRITGSESLPASSGK